MLTFASPWLLAATLALPALWWLIRHAPPPPRATRLPSIVLLRQLPGLPPVARRPPWWLAALRLGAVVLAILGLAGPAWRSAGAPPPAGPVALVIDNGWLAAGGFERLRAAARRELAALPPGTRVALVPTAPSPDGRIPAGAAPLVARDAALAALDALAAQPWAGDRAAAAGRIPAGARLVWVADGQETPDAARLRRAGGRVVVEPPLAPVITGVERRAEGLAVALMLPPGVEVGGVRARALDARGRTLAEAPSGAPSTRGRAEILLDLPPEVMARAAVLTLTPQAGAAGRHLLGAAAARPRVALVDGAAGEGTPPLERGAFYLRRALEPHAEVATRTLDEAARGTEPLIVTADAPVAAGPLAERLRARVRAGAVMVAFAGPVTAARGSALAPAPLAPAARALGGVLSWGEPQSLGGTAATTPLAGLGAPDLRVGRQLLARAEAPGVQRWAWLADGTPLVTARREGAGLLVLVHTSAAPDWSNLPLTGALEALLARLTPLATNPQALDIAPGRPWRLVQAMDGQGALAAPTVPRRLADADWVSAGIGPEAPPGLWRAGALTRARNLSDGPAGPGFAFAPLDTAGLERARAAAEQRLGPWLLAAALALLALDGALAAWRGRGQGRPAARVTGALPRRHRWGALLAALGLAAAPAASQAQPGWIGLPPPASQQAPVALGFVPTGNAARDAATRQALATIAETLTRRTAVRAGTPEAVRPGRDRLGRFPLLWWPVAAPLAPEAAAAARAYLAAGGLILFDTAGLDPASANAALAPLALPPLEPLEPAHVIARAFYALREPAPLGGLWVEAGTRGESGRVAGVLLAPQGLPALAGGADPAAREMAARLGVNLVLYALTGTYKADQVHSRALLDRLGAPP
jgi:hypothetical protein